MRLSPTPRPPRLSRAALIITLYLALAAAALSLGALRGHPNVFVLPGSAGPGGPIAVARGLLLGGSFALASVWAWRFAVHRLQWARRLRRDFRDLLGPVGRGEIVVLALASSLGEEMLFRGALLPALPGGLWSSSLLFALGHIGPSPRFLPWTASSLVAGLAFGAMFLATGDLIAPITAHFLINLLNLSTITGRSGWTTWA